MDSVPMLRLNSFFLSNTKDTLAQWICIVRNSDKSPCLMCIEHGKLISIHLTFESQIQCLKRIILLGNKGDIDKGDIVEYTDKPNIEQLVKVYEIKCKLLIVKLDGIVYLIKDKNNYRLVTSLLKDDNKSGITYIDRQFDLPSTEDVFIYDIYLTDSHTSGRNIYNVENDSNSELEQKILHPRNTLTRPTVVPPEDEIFEEFVVHQFNGIQNEICDEVAVCPFNGILYDTRLSSHGTQDCRLSIQETDGACSLSHESFVSNVGSKYTPAVGKYEGQSARRERANIDNNPPPRYPLMKQHEARTGTFVNSDWETQPNRPNTSILVLWGFFYTGRFDLVRCYQCGLGLKDWSIEDIVRDEHIRHSPDCAFLKEKLGPETLNQRKLLLLYQTDGSPANTSTASYRNQAPVVTSNSRFPRNDTSGATSSGSSSISSSASTNTSRTSSQTSDKKSTNKNNQPKLSYTVRHPEYQSMDTRQASYQTFPRHVQQDHRKLAIAGFYYTGIEDICRCFCCDGGIRHWDPEDDPIIEHAKHFPTCDYIKQIKGVEYIRKVRIEAGLEQEERPLQQNEESASPRAAVQASESTENRNLALSASSAPSQRVKIGPHRSMAVKNVLQSGFEKSKVEKAVDILIKRGTTDFTEDDIVNVILDSPEAHDADEEPEEGPTDVATNYSSPGDVLEENNRLKSVLNCIMCVNGEANILFLPCAHHKVCHKCSENIVRCPVCSREVTQKIKTYMS